MGENKGKRGGGRRVVSVTTAAIDRSQPGWTVGRLTGRYFRIGILIENSRTTGWLSGGLLCWLLCRLSTRLSARLHRWLTRWLT